MPPPTGQKELAKFYKPYLSDEEDDTSQESYTSSDESISSGSDKETTASVATASVVSPSQIRQNVFIDNSAPVSSGNDITPSQPADKAVILKQTKTSFTGGKNSTTILINSSDRDTTIYPQPTFFTLRLPRIYRNVVGINVTQIKLLSSFYYFSAAKGNTNLTVQELDRVKTVNGVDVSNAISIFIRDGTYDANSLVTELNNQLNQAPIYNKIAYSDFMSGFISTGDLTPLFNDPGDTTYNPVTGVFDVLTSKSEIISRYFGSVNNIGIVYYTSAETIAAYYYAMLRDLTIGQRPVVTQAPASPFSKICSTFINTANKPIYPSLNYYENDPIAQSYLNGGSPYDRIVFGFQGLDDPYIAYILKDTGNLAILQNYRDNNTWDGFLVNKYACSYDTTVGRLTIYSQQLNTSIVRTLNTQYQNILVKELTKQGITADQVAGIQTAGQNANGVIIDMYNKIQRAFTNFFAVPFGKYSASFYTNLSNVIPIFDASGRYGWNLIYTGSTQVQTSSSTYPDASGYWPRISFNPQLFQITDNDLYYPIPWDTTNKLSQYTYTHLPNSDSSGNIIIYNGNETALGYQDISFNILPVSYNRVIFKSRCRQEIFIETIPPFKNEIPPPNRPAETYYLDLSNTPLLYADASGIDCLLDPVKSDFIFFDVSQNLFDGPEFMRYISEGTPEFMKFIRETKPVYVPNEVPPPGFIGLYTFRPHVFFRILHSGYPVPENYYHLTSKIRSDIYIEREDGLPFGSGLDFYWYRNRAAFMADVSFNLENIYTANSKHYFEHVAIPADVSGITITLDFLSFQYSYGMVLSKNLASNMTLRIFALRHDPYGVYTYPETKDYRLLPIDTNYLATKTTPAINFPFPPKSLFNSTGFRNSYDLNGISNNLLDYSVLTTDFSHYDPYNFADNTTILQTPLRFVFQFKSPAPGPPSGVSSWSQYFSADSTNTIVDISNSSVYYDAAIAANEISKGLLPFTGISNEYVFTNWFRAGASTNLYDSNVNPLNYPEHTVAPLPLATASGNSPFSVLSPIPYSTDIYPDIGSKYKLSPFTICNNSTKLLTDISFNDLNGSLSQGQIYLGSDTTGIGETINNIMAVTFMPLRNKYITPKSIVIKYAYIQPSYDNNLVKRGRTTPLKLSSGSNYRYYSLSSSASYSTNVENDLATWDDQFYQNRGNLVLGVFRACDVNNRPLSSIRLSNALSTLSLKRVAQIGQYSSSTDPGVKYTRTRTPEWGTYYVYTANSSPHTLWYSWGQNLSDISDNSKATASTRWAAISLQSDISGTIYTTGLGTEADNISFYADVSNNGLCFIPFTPILNSNEQGLSQDSNPNVNPFIKNYTDNTAWRVGSFTGLTYTTLPYLPLTRAAALNQNPYVFYQDGTICIEDVGGDGVSLGATTTYLGTAGPLCFGTDVNGIVISPNYRVAQGFTPTFFNIRINISMSDVLYNPLADLSKFGGSVAVSGCYVDTQTHLYDLTTNPDSDIEDINTNWGSEKSSRFINYDGDSGFNYLSYMRSISVNRDFNYSILVRGYVPTVSFLTGVRIVGKNWTDFGIPSINNMIQEIADLSNAGIYIMSNGRLANDNIRIRLQYTYDYTISLLLFDAQFKGSFVMGQSIINASYPGITIQSSGFGDFINQFISYNSNIQSIVNGINAASTAALTAVRSYIKANYANYLPSQVLQRYRYTDPIMFSIQFKSMLIEPYASAYDNWGLGWNLGFAKIDTTYNTRHVAVTFIHIVDDFIYLKLNEELNLNNLDVSNKENLSLTRDTSGQSKRYFAKILLNTFGSFSQTLIQAAAPFITPLGRLDKISFQLVDAFNNNLNNSDCEYNIVLSVEEVVDNVDSGSMLVKGT